MTKDRLAKFRHIPELDPKHIIEAYTTPLVHHHAPSRSDLAPATGAGKDDFLQNVNVVVFGSKYTKGGESCGGPCNLRQMLLEPWECDAHFTSYENATGVRATKGDQIAGRDGMVFRIACFDLDWEAHRSGSGLPTWQDYGDFVRLMHVHDWTPNLIYNTQRGVRLLYLIKPITDPDVYEPHLKAFNKEIAEPLQRRAETKGGGNYVPDKGTLDWTRMFRAPSVIREDRDSGRRYEWRDSMVRAYHTRVMDLEKCEVPPPPEPPQGPAPPKIGEFWRDDLTLNLLVRDVTEGQRNTTVFRACCHALQAYEPAAAEQWIERIRSAANSAGMSEREFRQTLASARKRVG